MFVIIALVILCISEGIQCQRSALPQANIEQCYVNRAGGPVAAYCGNWLCGAYADTTTARIPNDAVGLYFGTDVAVPAAGGPPVVGAMSVVYFGENSSGTTNGSGLRGRLGASLGAQHTTNTAGVFTSVRDNWLCWIVTSVGNGAAAPNNNQKQRDAQPQMIESMILSGFYFRVNGWDRLGQSGAPILVAPGVLQPRAGGAAADVITAVNNIFNNFAGIVTHISTGMVA